MFRALLFEVLMIIALIIFIILVPGSSKLKTIEERSLMQEHRGHLADNSPVSGNNGTDGENQESASNENMLVSISRAKGGYTAFENGTFVTPAPLPVVDNDVTNDNDSDDSDSGNNGSEGSDASGDTTDNNASDSSDDNNNSNTDNNNDNNGGSDNSNGSNDNSASDFQWTLKDPETAKDTGKRATTTAPLKLRSTPTIQTEDNVIDSLGEGKELVVTDASVISTDPKVTNWVEVYYKGKIGYVSAKYVTIN